MPGQALGAAGFEPAKAYANGFTARPPYNATREDATTSGRGENDSALTSALSPLDDPNLTSVVEAWPKLPEHIKAAVLALVECARIHSDVQR